MDWFLLSIQFNIRHCVREALHKCLHLENHTDILLETLLNHDLPEARQSYRETFTQALHQFQDGDALAIGKKRSVKIRSLCPKFVFKTSDV